MYLILSSKSNNFHYIQTGIIVPLIIIVVSIVGIVYRVRKYGIMARINSDGDVEAKVNKTAAIVCGSYVTLLLPCFLVMGFDPMPPSKLDILHIGTIVLAWCTTFINPIIYFFANEFYKNECREFFKTIFNCCCSRRNHSKGIPIRESSASWRNTTVSSIGSSSSIF